MMLTKLSGSNSLPITEREGEALDLLCEGLTNDEIAARLHVSDSAIKLRLINAYDKLGANNRTHAAVIWTKRQAASR